MDKIKVFFVVAHWVASVLSLANLHLRIERTTLQRAQKQQPLCKLKDACVCTQAHTSHKGKNSVFAIPRTVLLDLC